MRCSFRAVVVFALAMAAAPALAAPVILFSDMVDGPKTGFDGSSTQGAAITIWGRGFGGSRGTSTLTVCGVTLDQDAQFAEWGASSNPQTASDQQRITFYLTSAMATGAGTIRVNVGGTDSNTIPFYCRLLGASHIYFVSPTGNDTNNGTSISTPWKTGSKLRATMVAGDIAYLRAGVYTDVDPVFSAGRANWIQIWGSNIRNGLANNSIGVISYPGEMAQIGNGELYAAANVVPENLIERILSGGVGTVWNYWTFSKMKMLLAGSVITEGVSDHGASCSNGDSNLRFIGNDIRSTSAYSGTGISFEKEGGCLGSTFFYLLGNYFHHQGVPNPPTAAPTLGAGTGSLTGAYNAKYTYASYSGSSLMQESEMSPAAASAQTLANQALRVTWTQPPASRQASSNRSFSHVRIYRTKAGGTTYFYDQDVPIAAGFVDTTTADGSLSARTKIEGGYYVGPMYFGGYGFLTDVFVMYNEMVSTNGTAIQNYGHVNGDYMDRLYFANNYMHDVGTCVWNNRPTSIFGGGDGSPSYVYAKNLYIYNNVYMNNNGSAIRVGSSSSGDGGNFFIANNVFYLDSAHGATAEQGFQMGGGAAATVSFRNNIVYTQGISLYNTPFFGTPQNSTIGLSGDHNLWFGLPTGQKPSYFAGTGDREGTLPGWFNPVPTTWADFMPVTGAAVIDAGATITFVTDDFTKSSRPIGSAYDMGPLESSASSGPALPTPQNVGIQLKP